MFAQKSQVFHKAVDELLFVSADEKLRFEYDQRLKAELDHYSSIRESHLRGLVEGEKKGKLEGKLEGEKKSRQDIARNMLRLQSDKAFISQITGLSLAEIDALEPYSNTLHEDTTPYHLNE